MVFADAPATFSNFSDQVNLEPLTLNAKKRENDCLKFKPFSRINEDLRYQHEMINSFSKLLVSSTVLFPALWFGVTTSALFKITNH